MLIDMDNLFTGVKATGADEQTITATAVSTNIIDLGAVDSTVPDPNIRGRHARILCQVTETFATLTSLEVILQTDDNTAFSSATELRSSGDVLAAALVQGKRIDMGVLPEGCERYVRLNFVVTGSNATAGKIVAGINFDQQVNAL